MVCVEIFEDLYALWCDFKGMFFEKFNVFFEHNNHMCNNYQIVIITI